jgi:hypothetical protein
MLSNQRMILIFQDKEMDMAKRVIQESNFIKNLAEYLPR